MTSIRQIADAIRNDIVSGLRGYHTNMSLSVDLLEWEIVNLRLAVINEYIKQGTLPKEDLITSLNCIPVDCDNLEKCDCSVDSYCGKPTAHFQIPQLLSEKYIQYIGSIDKRNSFLVYTKSLDRVATYLKYRKRGKNKPYVYIDMSPNSDGLLDCYIFGAPLIKRVSVIAIFKDPRQLEEYHCGCEGHSLDDIDLTNNINFIDALVKDRLTLLKITYYRRLAMPLKPNNQEYSEG